jgi:hypothetical protein
MQLNLLADGLVCSQARDSEGIEVFYRLNKDRVRRLLECIPLLHQTVLERPFQPWTTTSTLGS